MALNIQALPSIHGRRFGITRASHLVADGRIMTPSWRDRGARCIQFDHFEGAAISTKWITTLKGSDGSAVAPAIIADALGGKIRLTTGAGASTMAVNGSQLVGNKNFDPTRSGLEFTSALQMSAITNIALFVGFADSDTLLMPFTISAGTLTANCTDGHGFLFDTAATAATWKVVGCANGTKAAIVDTGVAPVAATDDLVRTEMSSDGHLSAFLNDLPVLSSGAAYGYATAGNRLTPTVAVFRRTTVSANVDVDFIYAAQDR